MSETARQDASPSNKLAEKVHIVFFPGGPKNRDPERLEFLALPLNNKIPANIGWTRWEIVTGDIAAKARKTCPGLGFPAQRKKENRSTVFPGNGDKSPAG